MPAQPVGSADSAPTIIASGCLLWGFPQATRSAGCMHEEPHVANKSKGEKTRMMDDGKPFGFNPNVSKH